MKRWAYLALGAVFGVVLAACGGGSNVAEGGIGGTGISSGSISAFGSIVVNGTRFDVDAAEITVNGDPNATQADLEVGYVVRVDGDLDDGVAESVRFDADLIGEVDDNQIATGTDTGTLLVMQQTVRVTATTTVTGGITPDAIQDFVNDGSPQRVLVSGFRNSSSELVATHLEVLVGGGIDQVVGTVTAVGANTFAIASGSTVLTVESPDPPDTGDRVLARGDYDPASQRFAASSVEQVEDRVIAGAEIELEGIVDTFSDLSDFTVDGVPVDASGATILDETGAPASGQVAQDVEVEVEGSFNPFGVLIAERVEVEVEDNVEIVAEVVDVDPVDGTVSFFDPGDGQGPRIDATVTAKTELRDDSSRDDGVFGLAEIVAGDWIELDGFEDSDGDVTALKIERFDPDPDPADRKVSVEGIVDGRDPALEILNLLGILFDTSTATFDGVGDLTGITPDDIVEVTWTDDVAFTQAPPGHPVDEVELEEDRTP